MKSELVQVRKELHAAGPVLEMAQKTGNLERKDREDAKKAMKDARDQLAAKELKLSTSQQHQEAMRTQLSDLEKELG